MDKTKLNFLFLILCIFYYAGAISQPAIEWSKCYGNSGEQRANALLQTQDGGYIVAGESYGTGGDVSVSHGASDFWIVKTDAQGNLQWEKSYGGSFWDEANDIIQTADGGYVICGATSSSDGDVTGYHDYNDMWIIRIDGAGNLQWQRCLGGSWNEDGWSILEALDGGVIVAGRAMSADGDVIGIHDWNDFWVVKLDISGNMQWNKCYGGNRDDFGYSITHNGSGGYVIAGQASSNGGDVTNIHVGGPNTFNPTYDYWIVNIDATGNIIWAKCFGGFLDETAQSIDKTTDGGYIIAGYTNSNDGDVIGWHTGGSPNVPNNDIWVVKIDETGILQWQKCYGGSGNDYAYSVKQTPDGGYVICGFTSSIDGDVNTISGYNDMWLIKTDDIGNIEWQKTYGGSQWETGLDIKLTQDGQLAFCGYTASNNGDVSGNHGDIDLWLVKLSGVSITGVQTAICSQCIGSATASVDAGVPPFSYLWSDGQTTATAVGLCSGTYTVSVTDALGATIIGNFFMINDTVIVSATQTPASCWSCPDGTATLHASGGTGIYTYSWQGYPDTTATLQGLPHGWVVGCVTDSLGCTDCDSIEVRSPVGINDIGGQLQLVNIFPNPSKGIITITFPAGFMNGDEFQFLIYDMQSRLLIESTLNNENTTIDLNSLSKGIYFIKITNGKSMVARKIVKE